MVILPTVIKAIALLLLDLAGPSIQTVTPLPCFKALYTCADPFAGQSMNEVIIVGGGIQIDLYVKAMNQVKWNLFTGGPNTRMEVYMGPERCQNLRKNLYGEGEPASQLADELELTAVGNLGDAFLRGGNHAYTWPLWTGPGICFSEPSWGVPVDNLFSDAVMVLKPLPSCASFGASVSFD